ncbi:MAG TPA: efflux RND transporter periplasmic adaptor subunit [Gemmataceae bacterium]|nr:efflux RND transporter periplasmic adaptor subunit [Gemmataceae bacterium]
MTSKDSTPVPHGFLGRAGFWVRFLFARLRFLIVLGLIGLAIVKWDYLVAAYEKHVRPADHDHAAGDVEYFCPMHPTVVRDTNKEKCPICFMPLSRRMKGEPTDDTLPAGTVARVQLTPYKVVVAGVQAVPVGFHPLHKEITTVGTIEFDERTLRNVSARFKGRIDQLFVNQTGQWVRKGDPLASLYGQDVVVTVQNLLDARQANDANLEKTARDRLKLWGIDDEQVADILKAGKPVTHLTVRSPIDGHVLKKYAREGQYVDEGGPLYDIADLSTVWVQAWLYEDDLPFLPKGHDPKTGAPLKPLPVSATARGLPGQTFDGMLSFVFPHVDPETRTLTVRFNVDNPDHELRPGMTTTVRLRIGPDGLKDVLGGRLRIENGQVLAVPEASVIDTGTQKVVYREEVPNTFDGVIVELGPRLTGPGGAYFPVLKGLEPGDRVVTVGSFLIDAETRLNPAMGSIYIGGSGTGRAGPAVRPTTPEDEEATIALALARLTPDDRALAERQRYCAVLEGARLGSMGKPVPVTVRGQRVFVCCKGCIKAAESDPDRTLRHVEELRSKARSEANPPKQAKDREKIEKALSELPAGDRAMAESQRLCPVTGQTLGAMGKPEKVDVDGFAVFTCCDACNDEVRERTGEMRKKVEELKKGASPRK